MAVSRLSKAAEPFRSLYEINLPLQPRRERPLRDFMPTIWPTWGDLKELIAALKAVGAIK